MKAKCCPKCEGKLGKQNVNGIAVCLNCGARVVVWCGNVLEG